MSSSSSIIGDTSSPAASSALSSVVSHHLDPLKKDIMQRKRDSSPQDPIMVELVIEDVEQDGDVVLNYGNNAKYTIHTKRFMTHLYDFDVIGKSSSSISYRIKSRLQMSILVKKLYYVPNIVSLIQSSSDNHIIVVWRIFVKGGEEVTAGGMMVQMNS
jgi:hypothetical protein